MSSTAPAAIDYLLTMLPISAALEGVQILDGPTTDAQQNDLIIIGWSSPDGNAITWESTPASLGTEDRENYEINCLASSWRGDPQVRPVRERVFAMLEAVRAELVRDQTLGGLVLRARVNFLSLDQMQLSSASAEAASGPSADLAFGIAISAFAR